MARLNDLPRTFKREGPPYTWIIDSIALQLSEFTAASDATLTQISTDDLARGGWLDVWGLLWGVPRGSDEADDPYRIRIKRTVRAAVGTVPAIQAWLNFYASGGTMVENGTSLGYQITLPPSMTRTQVIAFLFSLNRIRPAGVPFTISQTGTGIFLGTEAFLNTGPFIGAYLSAGTGSVALPIGASTPNSVPMLPGLYFDDPNLGQPGLLSLTLAGQWPLPLFSRADFALDQTSSTGTKDFSDSDFSDDFW